jgi:hypothetical protein
MIADAAAVEAPENECIFFRQTSHGQAGNYGQPQHEEACARQNSASQTGCFASAAALLIGASKYPVAQR